VDLNIPFTTRIEGAGIIADAVQSVSHEQVGVISLQRFHH